MTFPKQSPARLLQVNPISSKHDEGSIREINHALKMILKMYCLFWLDFPTSLACCFLLSNPNIKCNHILKSYWLWKGE